MMVPRTCWRRYEAIVAVAVLLAACGSVTPRRAALRAPTEPDGEGTPPCHVDNEVTRVGDRSCACWQQHEYCRSNTETACFWRGTWFDPGQKRPTTTDVCRCEAGGWKCLALQTQVPFRPLLVRFEPASTAISRSEEQNIVEVAIFMKTRPDERLEIRPRLNPDEGDQAEALAKQRGVHVRVKLLELGLGEDRLELAEPEAAPSPELAGTVAFQTSPGGS